MICWSETQTPAPANRKINFLCYPILTPLMPGDGIDLPQVNNPLGRSVIRHLDIWCLEGGFCITAIDKRVWNTICVSYDKKSTGSCEDANSMLNIVFMAAVISGAGSIKKN